MRFDPSIVTVKRSSIVSQIVSSPAVLSYLVLLDLVNNHKLLQDVQIYDLFVKPFYIRFYLQEMVSLWESQECLWPGKILKFRVPSLVISAWNLSHRIRIFSIFSKSPRGGGVFQGLNKGLYQSTNNLFHYASHTQQKLISRWGEGKFQRIIFIT